MDPVLLFLVGFVVLAYFSFVILLALRIRSVTREKDECRVIIASLKNEPQETEVSPLDSYILAESVIDFALAYYKRTRARGEKKVGSANTAMAICWRKLSDDSQEKLAVLGGLANLRVGDNFSP
jgi:hypothetical protein